MVAEFRKADKTLTMWSSTQLPHVLRNYLAEQLGLLQYQLRVIAPEVGGGFGCKQDIYPEEALVAFAAMQTGHPVKWIEDRSESFTATIHGRGQVDYIEVCCHQGWQGNGAEGPHHFRPWFLSPILHRYHCAGPDTTHGRWLLRHSPHVYCSRSRLHQQDTHRCIPRSRSSRGNVYDRARDEPCSPRTG